MLNVFVGIKNVRDLKARLKTKKEKVVFERPISFKSTKTRKLKFFPSL